MSTVRGPSNFNFTTSSDFHFSCIESTKAYLIPVTPTFVLSSILKDTFLSLLSLCSGSILSANSVLLLLPISPAPLFHEPKEPKLGDYRYYFHKSQTKMKEEEENHIDCVWFANRINHNNQKKGLMENLPFSGYPNTQNSLLLCLFAERIMVSSSLSILSSTSSFPSTSNSDSTSASTPIRPGPFYTFKRSVNFHKPNNFPIPRASFEHVTRRWLDGAVFAEQFHCRLHEVQEGCGWRPHGVANCCRQIQEEVSLVAFTSVSSAASWVDLVSTIHTVDKECWDYDMGVGQLLWMASELSLRDHFLRICSKKLSFGFLFIFVSLGSCYFKSLRLLGVNLDRLIRTRNSEVDESSRNAKRMGSRLEKEEEVERRG
ncbi:hypothetical protein CJ030_MR4G020685 [Morella rubra]|uniref:Uncharacterized protein n=1 Tax=Morella rubra TaxID=262757 RepID=A0A6A1VWL0_9ROSI|nr:hypothetical protein CJ030_MR4G020685 [Morella rubra]